MFFCPACNGRVLVSPGGTVAIVVRPLPQDPDLTNTFFDQRQFLYCTACPVVTLFDGVSGRLNEFPTLSVTDLTAPFVPGVDGPPPVSVGSTLQGRADS